MKNITAKNGQSEWQAGSISVIAIAAKLGCIGCDLRFMNECSLVENISGLPNCIEDFSRSIIYIEKPAE